MLNLSSLSFNNNININNNNISHNQSNKYINNNTSFNHGSSGSNHINLNQVGVGISIKTYDNSKVNEPTNTNSIIQNHKSLADLKSSINIDKRDQINSLFSKTSKNQNYKNLNLNENPNEKIQNISRNNRFNSQPRERENINYNDLINNNTKLNSKSELTEVKVNRNIPGRISNVSN